MSQQAVEIGDLRASLGPGDQANAAKPRPSTTADSLLDVWPTWRWAGALFLVSVSIFFAGDAWSKMLQHAIDGEESSHIFLVGIAVPWLVWASRERLAQCRPTGTWIGPIILALGWASLVYGYDIHDNEFWFFGAILAAIGCFLAFVGLPVLVRFLPVFIVLGFLIPVPGAVRQVTAVPLQTAMAYTTEHVVDVLGIAIDRTGNLLLVNGQPVGIVEACNGMRMIFALFLVAYTYAFSTPLRAWVRGLILIAAPALALGCNVIRMVPTVLLFGYASKDTADTFHDAAGWLMIPVAVLLLMGVVSLLEWTGIPVMQRRTAQEASS